MPPSTPAATQLQGINLARFATRTHAPQFVTAIRPPGTTVAAVSNVAALSTVAAVKPEFTRVGPSARIEDLKAIDPRIARRISAIPGFIGGGVERSQLTGPLSLTGEISEQTLLEDAQDSAKRYYLPRYQVKVEATTRGDQFAVRLLANPRGCELSVSIGKSAPEEVQRQHPGAQELPHGIALILRYKQRVNGQPSAVSELAFTSTTPEANEVRGVLVIDSLAKRNEVYGALTDPELGCALVVRRKATIAVPAPPQTNRMLMRADLRVIDRRDHRVNRPKPLPEPVTPAVPRFRQTERVLDQELPFFFDPALNRYIFEGLGTMTPGRSQGLLRKLVTWKGQTHVYYQDDAARNVFYYLPDTFKIARRPAAPHEPLLSVRFESPDGSKEAMQAILTYCAVPYINQDRLTSAVPALKEMVVPPELLGANGGIEFEPLLPDPAKIKLRLSYPGADVTGGPFAPRSQATVDLRSGIVDALTLTLEQFRALYEALFSGGQLLFSGSVEFDMGGTGEQIPFQLRMHSLAEPFASWTPTADADDLLVTLTNEIESKLKVLHLDAIVQQENELVVKPLAPAAGAYPIEIEPSGTASFRLPQAAGLTLTQLDFSEVECMADKSVVYDLILDPSTVPSYLREITVKSFKQFFQEQPAKPDSQIMSLVVDFQGGAAVELTADQLSATVKVPVPLAEFIVGSEETQQYRYKLTVARLGGVTTDADWRTGQSAILFLSVN